MPGLKCRIVAATSGPSFGGIAPVSPGTVGVAHGRQSREGRLRHWRCRTARSNSATVSQLRWSGVMQFEFVGNLPGVGWREDVIERSE